LGGRLPRPVLTLSRLHRHGASADSLLLIPHTIVGEWKHQAQFYRDPINFLYPCSKSFRQMQRNNALLHTYNTTMRER
jgi:hypothetical protein